MHKIDKEKREIYKLLVEVEEALHQDPQIKITHQTWVQEVVQ